jgi:predicted transcriptional regulator
LFKANATAFRGYNGIKLSDVVKSKAEIGSLLILAESMYRDTNIICKYVNKRYIQANEEDIAEILQMHPKRAKEFVNKMVRLGVMARTHKVTDTTHEQYLYLSPLYFNSSKYISPSLYMLFKEQLNCYIPMKYIDMYNEVLK